MKIINFSNFSQLSKVGSALITLGNFDGFHSGQQKVLTTLVKRAREFGVKSLVFTFNPHPRQGDKDFPGLIYNQNTKNKLFHYFGVDYVCYLNFFQVKEYEYYQFLNLVQEKFIIRGLVASEKLKFGSLKKGSFVKIKAYFEKQSQLKHFSTTSPWVEKVPCYTLNKVKLSSSFIRSWLEKNWLEKERQEGNYLTKGNKHKGNEYLPIPFHLSGVVRKGKQLGRTIGFPTMNFAYPSQQEAMVKIPDGSYVTLTLFQAEIYLSVTYVGEPYQSLYSSRQVETHLFDFNKINKANNGNDDYGKEVTVFFLSFLGISEPTKNVAEVKVVISKYKERSLAYFNQLSQTWFDKLKGKIKAIF